MSFVQVVRWNPPKKTKWAREFCSHVVGHIQGYKLSSYLLAEPYPLKILSLCILHH
jgi:hypothetical protein